MTQPRKSGLYALIRTDGGPLAPRDLQVLGLNGTSGASWQVAASDPCAAAVDRFDSAGETTVLVGDLWDLADSARRLGLADGSGPAKVAAATLNKHADATPQHLRGEWTLFQRQADGHITVMLSTARRDPLLYARQGPRIAIAPDLFTLARLDWVDRSIDEAGLLYALGKGPWRLARGERTMLRAVSELEPGGVLRINPAGELRAGKTARAAAPANRITDFAEAVEHTRALLLDDMRQRIERYPDTAILLSGGLDSSLIAWLVAACGADTSRVKCFTSAAPPGSRLADETGFAGQVAGHLGLPLIRVVPAADSAAYRPHADILSGANGPPLSNRHALTEAFQQAARAAGSTRLLNGTYGELTVTARLPSPGRLSGLNSWRALLRRLRQPRRAKPGSAFHVRLAPHRPLPAFAPAPPPDQQAGPLFGWQNGTSKALSLGNEFYAGAVRMDYPFRNPELLQLIAGLPRSVPAGRDGNRAIARALLDRQLPDAIRLRQRGLPASPDHLLRLQRHAPAARERIAAFRAAGIGEWLDLAWLDQALAAVAAAGVQSHHLANEIQLTAITAEFLLWWRAQV